ncbi:efflux RND transporter permease subunit [Alkaliphilus hydrothermalis]|uniref:HAE1 family hydrophobic/amphiphilic exporter-1 n=1 Tax=Alkaliphilus hydrothermalis TaxID=1482730 RepID=A0ABS2NT60_9FIRM|nr:efflux RND transporter permease subunit [Alkaliphilus hydrothermalis]MBM7616091.1 HAE1 family hydrophobic/amphiphilic exporter-1 [Alkaliphilus hydrothermalis]
MNLSTLSVKRPVTVVMLTLMVVIMGVVSLTRLPIDLLPEFEIPVVVVSTSYNGAGPREVEELITRPLENVISTVNNITSVTSTSSEGNSLVIAQFSFGTDMNFASLDMREKVDLIKGMLPSGVGNPMILKIDPNSMPIMQIAIAGTEDLATLQVFGEDVVKPRLERLEGVASVNVSGGQEYQVEIVINQNKMLGYGISMDQLAQMLRVENLNLPGGEITRGQQKISIRTVGQFTDLEEIKSLAIPLATGGSVPLEEIAEVKLNFKDSNSYSRVDGQRSINVSLQKQSGTNTVSVADLVNEEIGKIQEEYSDMKVQVMLDQSMYIKKSINNVMKNAIFGGLLAIIILYLFLRNIRTTLIIGAAIPISVIATFILIYFNGITLNLMTLGGLALGIGMLVDNAIVVLENIYRFRQEGFSRKEAAIKGANEVAMAVVASTLTTVAVFLPIVFVQGITSTIFKQLALTVSLSLGASLVVSLTLIPMLASKLLKVEAKKENRRGILRLFDGIYNGFDRIFKGFEAGYKSILSGAFKRRKTTVTIGILVFAVSMASIGGIGAEFFPTMDEGQFTVTVKLPVGSSLASTNEIVSEVEAVLGDIEEITSVATTIGSSGMSLAQTSAKNTGSISVSLKPVAERQRSTGEVVVEVREKVIDIPGAEITVEEASSTMAFGGGGAPVNISIKGDDLDELQTIGNDFVDIVRSVEGTQEVKNSLSEGVPELKIQVNRQYTSQYGLTAGQIASAIRNSISGQVATRYKVDGTEIDVVIKGDPVYQEGVSKLNQLTISSPMGVNVPLNQLADISIQQGPSTINRVDQVRVITVTSDISGRDLRGVVQDIEEKLQDYQMPTGYEYEIGGENKEMVDAFSDLALALLLAVVFVYMILASQFESLIHPFTIMLSVPLAFAGGILGLFITGRTLSVPAFIGVIMLAGIVVNNAIVLVDYINIRRGEGEERKEAILNAGPIRLRPILMTTLTTVLGLLPLALGIGEGAEAQAPMATVVIGGLLLSTLLTLVFIPVMYTIFDDFNQFIKSKILKKKATTL